MAIVKMNKISVIAFLEDKTNILNTLMKAGNTQFTEQEITDELFGIADKDGNELEVSKLELELQNIGNCINHLKKYDKTKKPLFAPRRNVGSEEYGVLIENKSILYQIAERAAGYIETINRLKTEENKLENQILSYTPWKNLEIPVEVNSTRHSKILTGTVLSMVKEEEFISALKENEAYAEILNSDKDQHYVTIIYHNSNEEKVSDTLKQFGFSKVIFRDITGTIDSNIKKSKSLIKQIKSEQEETKKSIEKLTSEIEKLEVLYDYLTIERDKAKSQENFIKTGKTFMITGYIESSKAESVKTLLAPYQTIIETKEADKEEEFPILLKNPGWVKPFEMITSLYSLPSSKGIDPNIIMAPFYFLFFGLMLGDAGYGIILTLATLFMLKKFKFEGLIDKLVKLICLCGISTFIWGAAFGGWFGDSLYSVFKFKSDVRLLWFWFDPMQEPMKLLVFSFILGIIHIFAGMAIQAFMMIREGKILDAIFDVFTWWAFIIGLLLLAFKPEIGKYMSIISAGILILTQGRSEKNIIKKVISGVLSLYNITGYLSDVLSYSRLLALGLATGVIGTVINTMGTMIFGSASNIAMKIIGLIVLILVFVGGHIFNLLINALGAYVHASRLQYVEFFSKFYISGGKAFKPFKIQTKYIELADNKKN